MNKNSAKKTLYLLGNILFLVLIIGLISLIDKNYLSNKFLYCLLVCIVWRIFNFMLKKLLDIIFKTNDMLEQKYITHSIKYILVVLLIVFIGDFWSNSSNNHILKYFIGFVVFILGNLAIEYIFNRLSK